MIDIQPRTYNEALRLSRCMEVRKYAPNVTSEMIKQMYLFISENPQNKIGVSNGTIYYTNNLGTTSSAFTVNTVSGLDHLTLGWDFFRVVNTTTDSGGSSCGGCSSNNNNNNNNNNNG